VKEESITKLGSGRQGFRFSPPTWGARLCAEGYASQMVLSHDANCWTDMQSEEDKR